MDIIKDILIIIIGFLIGCLVYDLFHNSDSKQLFKQFKKIIKDLKSYKDKVINYNPEKDPAYLEKRKALAEKTAKEIKEIKANII